MVVSKEGSPGPKTTSKPAGMTKPPGGGTEMSGSKGGLGAPGRPCR